MLELASWDSKTIAKETLEFVVNMKVQFRSLRLEFLFSKKKFKKSMNCGNDQSKLFNFLLRKSVIC